MEADLLRGLHLLLAYRGPDPAVVTDQSTIDK